MTANFAPWPSFTAEEIEAVSNVLASGRVNYWTGDETRQFEREFAAWAETKHAIAVANGTVALDLALKGLGIGPGDEVVVTPRTFIASVSCVVNAGATPVFADVDRASGNLSADTIAEVLTPCTKAVIAVHLAGWPCDMDPIMDLAEQHGFKVIEDCAQAHGARYKGRSLGSIGHVAAWSFCQDKIMTTGGEGGMVTVNDDALWSSMWSFKDHGKSWDAVYAKNPAPGFRWLHETIGTNWRMMEMQAVIGRIQLQRMTDWTAKRTANAMAIHTALEPFSGVDGVIARSPVLDGGSVHAYYKYYAYVRDEHLADGWTRDRIVAEISARGVPCFQGSCSEVYREKAFDGTGWRPAQPLPTTLELGLISLMFLVHPTLTPENMEATTNAISAVLAQAQRSAA